MSKREKKFEKCLKYFFNILISCLLFDFSQRSPVMVSLLPTSKDSGAWLLNRRQQMPKVIR